MYQAMIIDDHPLWCDALSLVLARHGYATAVKAGTVAEALAQLRGTWRKRHLDLVVVDVDLPDGSGFQVLDQLRGRKCVSVLVTAEESPRTASQALQAGATAFIPKNLAADEIMTLIHKASAGRVSMPAVTRRAMERAGAAGPRVALTRREMEVLLLLCSGVVDVSDLAASCHVSPSTIRGHLKQLHVKLGVSERAGVVAAAYRLGIVTRVRV